MNTSAVVTFAIIASFIWGGAIFLIVTAFRREGAKKARAADVAVSERARES